MELGISLRFIQLGSSIYFIYPQPPEIWEVLAWEELELPVAAVGEEDLQLEWEIAFNCLTSLAFTYYRILFNIENI